MGLTTAEPLESESIRKIIERARASGNEIDYAWDGWTETRIIVFMREKLSDELKRSIRNDFTDVEYWCSEATPHSPASEGFTSRHKFANQRESVLFPIGERKWDIPEELRYHP